MSPPVAAPKSSTLPGIMRHFRFDAAYGDGLALHFNVGEAS